MLSSNEIFMGIISSRRVLHMLNMSRALAHVMGPELQEIDLTLMFRRYLTICDLQLRVFVGAEQLGDSYPKGKCRGSLLE
jgi:hypothetical protein